MKKATIFASAAALAAAMAAPVAAQEVPLNTVAGGEGSETATGQGALLAGGLAGTTSIVVGLTVLTVVAASESSGTTAVAE